MIDANGNNLLHIVSMRERMDLFNLLAMEPMGQLIFWKNNSFGTSASDILNYENNLLAIKGVTEVLNILILGVGSDFTRYPITDKFISNLKANIMIGNSNSVFDVTVGLKYLNVQYDLEVPDYPCSLDKNAASVNFNYVADKVLKTSVGMIYISSSQREDYLSMNPQITQSTIDTVKCLHTAAMKQNSLCKNTMFFLIILPNVPSYCSADTTKYIASLINELEGIGSHSRNTSEINVKVKSLVDDNINVVNINEKVQSLMQERKEKIIEMRMDAL